MKRYKLWVLLFVLFKIGISQNFNAETGEIISDTTVVNKFDPKTGLPIEINSKNIVIPNTLEVKPYFPNKSEPKNSIGLGLNEINNFQLQIISKAKFDAKQNVNSTLWALTSLPLSGLSLFVGLITSEIMHEFADMGALGFIGGTGITALMVPQKIIKSISGIPLHIILDAEDMYLNQNERRIYLEEYQKEIDKLRLRSIYMPIAGAGGFILFMTMMIII